MKNVLGKVLLGSTACVGLTLGTAGLAVADPGGRHTVQAPPGWTAASAKVGKPAASDLLHLSVVLNLKDAAGAEAYATAVSEPGNAAFGRYLTAAQWRSRFAPSDADAKVVSDWLSAQGFTVTGTPANHRFITVDGTAAQADAAFGSQLATYDKAGKAVRAPSAPLSVPDQVATLVSGVAGLDASALSTPDHIGGREDAPAAPAVAPSAAKAAAPAATLPPPGAVFKNAPPCSAYYGEKPAPNYPQILPNPLTYVPCGYKPPQLRGAYGTDQAQAQGYDGRGATVAVVDAYASPTILSDAQTYASNNDPSHPLRSYQFSQNLPANYRYVTECDAAGWYGEETLDVEAVHAMAPGADILYVGGASCDDNDLVAAVNTVLDNDLAQIITNSYGDVGEPSSVAEVAAAHQSALQAAAQGVTLTFSSGDSGDEKVNTGKRQVDYEASDPFVTAVGGTSLNVTASNGYGWEQGWGTGKSVLTNGAWDPNPPAYLYGGGGGTSRLFKQPGYQKGVVPDRIANYFGQGPHRAVPDVAMVGDPNTGMLVGQTQTFPNGSQKYSEYRIGGTSLSSPLFAGTVAVATQVKGGPLGFLNPRIYKLAGSDAFRDVTHKRGVTDGVVRVDYVNGVNANDGTTTSLRTINQTGSIYVAPGYDDVTGVGSPNGLAFLVKMAGGKAAQ